MKQRQLEIAAAVLGAEASAAVLPGAVRVLAEAEATVVGAEPFALGVLAASLLRIAGHDRGRGRNLSPGYSWCSRRSGNRRGPCTDRWTGTPWCNRAACSACLAVADAEAPA